MGVAQTENWGGGGHMPPVPPPPPGSYAYGSVNLSVILSVIVCLPVKYYIWWVFFTEGGID